MINSLRELNDKITQFANYIVKSACEETFSGSYNIEIEEVCAECNISLEDFRKYESFFKDELNSREELLEVVITNNEIDISCALDYCPNYEWENGDEKFFGSFEEFITRDVKPYLVAKEPQSLKQVIYSSDFIVNKVNSSAFDSNYKKEGEALSRHFKQINNGNGTDLTISPGKYISVGKDGTDIYIRGDDRVAAFNSWEDLIGAIDLEKAAWYSIDSEKNKANGIITLSAAPLTVDELSSEQLTILKQNMYSEINDTVSWSELADIDNLVSDEEVKEYYKDFTFTEDDFSSNINSRNLDSMIESAQLQMDNHKNGQEPIQNNREYLD